MLLSLSFRFDSVLRSDNRHTNALFNLSGLVHMFGYPSLAMGYTHRLLLETPNDMTAHAFLWTLTNTNSDCDSVGTLTDTAINIYKDIHSATGNVLALHKLVTLQGVNSSNIEIVSNNPAYAKIIYNDMAEKFENKLVNHLQYDAPWTMHQRIMKIIESRMKCLKGDEVENTSSAFASAPVTSTVLVDLGCGSGLVGRIFNKFVKHGARDINVEREISSKLAAEEPSTSEFESTMSTTSASIEINHQEALLSHMEKCTSDNSGSLIGIDISSAMVGIAASYPNCYDLTLCLDVKEALSTLSKSACKIDLLIAADTFIYLGLLGEIFFNAKNVLRHNAHWGGSGIFSFTVENLDNSPMKKIRTESRNTTGCKPAVTEPSRAMQYEPKAILSGQWDLGEALQLLTSARFAHSSAYIHALATKYGFRICEEIDIVLRTEGTVPLGGKIYIMELTSDMK